MPKRYTYGEVKEIFKEKGYELLNEDYINNKQKLSYANKDGYRFNITLDSALNKGILDNRPIASKDNMWSIYNINNYLKLNKETCKLISTEFKNQSQPLDWVCKDGHEFHTNWNNFHNKGFRCKTCGHERAKISFEECYESVNKREGYELIKMYREVNGFGALCIHYIVKHECGNEYHVTKQSFDKGTSCRPCARIKGGLKKRYTDEEVKAFVDVDDEYEYLGNKFDKNGTRKIKVKHYRCGRTKWVSLGNWKSGKRCINCACSDSSKIKKEELINRVETQTDHEFKFIDVFYKVRLDNGRNEGYLKIKHNKCDHEFTKSIGTWNSIKNKKCPKCSNLASVSYLHSVMAILFDKYYDGVEFEKDFGFKGMRGGKSKYDLFVPNYNGVDTIFEFQSRFHDGKEEFDDLKRQFVINDGYRFIAIDHRDVDILDVVKKYFPSLDDIPQWMDEELYKFKKLNLVKAQELLDKMLPYKEIAKILNVGVGAISGAVSTGRLVQKEGHLKKTRNIKTVVQLTMDGEYVNTFKSSTEVKKKLSIHPTVNYGKVQCLKGYAWITEEDYLSGDYIIPDFATNHCKTFLRIDDDFNIIKEYTSLLDAVSDIGVTSVVFIKNVLTGKQDNCKGHRFVMKYKYEDLLQQNKTL